MHATIILGSLLCVVFSCTCRGFLRWYLDLRTGGLSAPPPPFHDPPVSMVPRINEIIRIFLRFAAACRIAGIRVSCLGSHCSRSWRKDLTVLPRHVSAAGFLQLLEAILGGGFADSSKGKVNVSAVQLERLKSVRELEMNWDVCRLLERVLACVTDHRCRTTRSLFGPREMPPAFGATPREMNASPRELGMCFDTA